MTIPVMSPAGMLAMKQQYPTLRNGKPLRDKDIRDIAILIELVSR
jgi:lincosamide nucleotidyltransferase A/C/D/E